jgi:Protein of unknown function (DUF4038)
MRRNRNAQTIEKGMRLGGVVKAGIWTALGLACVAAAVAVRYMLPIRPVPADVQAAAPVRAATTQDAVFPLRLSATRRYLVDRHNHPFLIVGDSPQALIVNVTVKQAAEYLVNRKDAGFNTMWINLLSDGYAGGRPDGSTYDGIRPFKREGDLSIPSKQGVG